MVSGEGKCKGTEVERSLESLSHPAEARVEKNWNENGRQEAVQGERDIA